MPSQHRIRTPRAATWAGITGLAGAFALTACLTDGPNRTGGGFLERHGLLLEMPLHRIEVKDFPVDSFYVGDLDPGRMGDSLFLLGRWRGFTSQARLGFDLADTNFVDSLQNESTLRLALGFPIPNRADAQLKAMTFGRDSMTVVVESWAYEHRANPDSLRRIRADSLRRYNHRFLARQDTAALFSPDQRFLDTIRISVKTLYEKDGARSKRDSVQVFPLPNLREELSKGLDDGIQWLVYMQLTHLPKDSADTVMLRVGGEHGGLFRPMLLFGNDAGTARHPATATVKQRSYPLFDPVQGRLGVNTRYRYTGSTTAMLTGKTRGLHLRLDRAALLDSLDRRLRLKGSSLARASDGEFDLAYYVPFAQLTVPLKTPSVVEGGFPLDMRLVSDLDSLLPKDSLGDVRFLAKGKDEVVVVQYERNSLTKVADSVVARYEAVGSLPGLYRFLLWGEDTSFKDTTYFRDGETKEVLRASAGARTDRLVFTAKAQGDTLAYRIHVNTKGVEEDVIFKDAATGARLTDLAQRIPRFLKPQDASLTLRATRGFQRMLNRARLGQEIQSDFFVQPVRNAAADTASKLLVPYPVLGEIEPDTKSGRLGVDIVLYLYPLKTR